MGLPRVNRVWLLDLIRFYKREIRENSHLSEYYEDRIRQVREYLDQIDEHDKEMFALAEGKIKELSSELVRLEQELRGGHRGC